MKALVFGAGVVFEYFVRSNDIASFDIVSVVDNNKAGTRVLDYDVLLPEEGLAKEFDIVILTLWDKPEVINAVSTQLIGMGVSEGKIKVYSYDRHILCDLSMPAPSVTKKVFDSVLYAFYDLNRNSETYDITSFLVTADCYRQEHNLQAVHIVIVARDEEWQAQAYCLENAERQWRAENIVRQACTLLPSCHGSTFCSVREQASMYLDGENAIFPPDYRLNNPPPITVHKDFYYWFEKGFDPRQLKAPAKAIHYAKQFVDNKLVSSKEPFITVTLRESTLQPKRNSDLPQWNSFFKWLNERYPMLNIVVIRDTEQVFSAPPFDAVNISYCSEAAFHMGIRMALYELAYVNMGCSNGPKQLCHLSKTASFITTKMIVEDYQGSSSARFIERQIEIGKDFKFSAENQMIDWNDDTRENLIASFERFTSVRPLQ